MPYLDTASLPHYKSLKTRQAVKIERVETTIVGNRDYPVDSNLFFEDGSNFTVSEAWMAKHNPSAGDYFLIYNDGEYISSCPGDVFLRDHEVVTVPVPQDSNPV